MDQVFLFFSFATTNVRAKLFSYFKHYSYVSLSLFLYPNFISCNVNMFQNDLKSLVEWDERVKGKN